MKKALRVNDFLSFKDNSNVLGQSHGLWARTKIMISHDDIEYDKNGIAHFIRNIPTGVSSLGETIFRKVKGTVEWESENMVPIGGCQYAMELLFGVGCDQITVPTLYSETGIGLPDSLAPTDTYNIPGGTNNPIYRYGHFVQLFGVGVTGTAENDVTVHPVDYREHNIDINRVTTDGATLRGTMIPFRFTAETLADNDRLQYFGKKVFETGETGYYLKKFENDPVIKHIWKTGDDVDEETLVSSSEVWENNIGINAVESFTECTLKVTKRDVKEWFISLDQEDRARINTLALFNGRFIPDNSIGYGDYQDVRLFSKLNIPTEYLSLSKDLNIIYRVYTS